MKRLRTNPAIAAKTAAAASERMKRLNADPEFAAAASERMKRLLADPAFATKRIAGLRRRRKTQTPEP